MKDPFIELGLDSLLGKVHPGVWSKDGWLAPRDTGVIESINPSNGQVLGRVQGAGLRDLQNVIESSRAAFALWREVPAPQRGEIIRQIGHELRRHKDALGTLVSLETGKCRR